MNTILENSSEENTAEATRTFFRSVYTYMFAALGISGIIAFRVGNDPVLFQEYFVSASGSLSPVFLGGHVFTYCPELFHTMGLQ